ncbi:MAG: VPLPA-CTERM sorting domain-containing protein [Geminicoccaceae bacterium]
MKGLVLAAVTAGAALSTFLPGSAEAAITATFNFSKALGTLSCPSEVSPCGSADISNQSTFTFTNNGVQATVTATGGNPYYDLTGAAGNRTGLGVADSGTNGGDDEQIDQGEVLKFVFSPVVSVLTGTFYDRDHGLFTGNILLNGVSTAVANGVLTFAALSGGEVTFGHVGTAQDPMTQNDYYVGQITTTPLPGAVLLFGSALAGLGVARRRKAQAVAV